MLNNVYNMGCIDLCKEMIKKNIEVDLIYIDPPFNTGRDFKEFNDKFDSLKIYIRFIKQNVKYLYKILKNTGSFYIHVDPRVSHYLKVELDKIFGIKNFRNEIAWCYDKFSNRANSFLKDHDTILLYSKSDKYMFNKLKKDSYILKESAMKILECGYHVLNNHKKLLVYNKERAINKIKECEDKKFQIKYLDGKYKYESDWWTDITNIPAQSRERLGYPTQKPEALLERIILASSNPGDIVADFFCGSGTTLYVANKLDRKYIGCDINKNAVDITSRRINGEGFRC